jgi:hypothetical protein
MVQNPTFQQCVRVCKYDEPMSWRLLSEHAGPENVEEVVLRVQGVIAQKDLPPLTNRPAYASLIHQIKDGC